MPALDSLILGVKHTCLTPGPGAELAVTLRSTTSSSDPAYLSCEISKPGGFSSLKTLEGQYSTTFRFSPVEDGVYTIVGRDQDQREVSRTDYEIKCGGVVAAPGTCDLAILDVVVFPPTDAQSGGAIAFTLSTSAASVLASAALVSNPSNPVAGLSGPQAPGRYTLYNLPAGEYQLLLADSNGCTLPLQPFTVPAYVAEPVPVVPPVPLWFAVGGLLPRPALLLTEVSSLHDTNFAPRIGLHVQVELTRDGEEEPFARLRKTVRRTLETVDISQALHTQLVPEARYPVGVVSHDGLATLAFRARYREVDQDGEGEWQELDVVDYAVLSAVPQREPIATYLATANAPAKSLSAFDSGQAVHWVGLPFDVAVWLPEERPAALYAEFLYRNGFGQTLEVCSIELPSSLPPGVTRVPLPKSPPALATTLTFQLTDTARTTAPDQVPTVPELHDYLIPDLNDNDFR